MMIEKMMKIWEHAICEKLQMLIRMFSQHFEDEVRNPDS